MAIVHKHKWTGGYCDESRQAIVLLEDGIWRVCRGNHGGYEGVFYFVHGGMMYCADRYSFREIDVNTPEDEIYALVCDINIDNIARDAEIKKIIKRKNANRTQRAVRTTENEERGLDEIIEIMAEAQVETINVAQNI